MGLFFSSSESRHNLHLYYHPILHATLIFIGGISQLLFLRILSFNLDLDSLNRGILILGFSIIASFLDFGALACALYLFAYDKHAGSGKTNSLRALSFYYLNVIVLSHVMFALLFIRIGKYSDFAVFLIINALSLYGTWTLVIMRAIGRITISLIFLNSQWPISLGILIILEKTSYQMSYKVAFLPTLVTCLIVNSFCVYLLIIKRPFFNFKLGNWKELSTHFRSFFSLLLSLIAVTPQLPIILHSDRYILYARNLREGLPIYSVYATIFAGVVSILSVSNSIKIAELLGNELRQTRLPKLPMLGLLCSGLYFILTPFIFKYMFPNLATDFRINISFAMYIFMISLMYEFSLPLSRISVLRKKRLYLWIHLLVWSLCMLILLPYINYVMVIGIGMAACLVHIGLLTTHRRNFPGT